MNIGDSNTTKYTLNYETVNTIQKNNQLNNKQISFIQLDPKVLEMIQKFG